MKYKVVEVDEELKPDEMNVVEVCDTKEEAIEQASIYAKAFDYNSYAILKV